MAKLECPAAPPGFRDAGNNKGYGTLYSVGTSGFNWSSTRTDTSAHYLYFSSPWLNPEGNSSRAHGFLLRCLQEKGTNRIGSADRRNFAKKSPAFACRAAPEPAVGRRLARATLRVAVVQLDARLQTINRESSAHRPPYGPDCCSKTAICDRAPLRRPPRRAQLRCCSAGYGAFSEKEPRPTVTVHAPAKSCSNAYPAFERFRYLRRGARCRSALEPGCVYPNKGSRRDATRRPRGRRPN